jgi:tagatose 1,6-diphosphate aldolase
MGDGLTPGKIRGLATTSTADGIFTILALDHRDSLRAVLAPDDPGGLTADELIAHKLRLLRGLVGAASGVMLDPEYSAAQAICARALPGTVGFLVAAEAQGYLHDATVQRTRLLDGWSVAKARRLGASGVKLLVLYRPDAGEVTEQQDRTVAAVVADCAREDLPLFLEPLAYPVGEERDDPATFAQRRRRIVVDSVRRLSALGPDVLKVGFPVDADHEPDRAVWHDACAELDDAAGAPWALLSGGVDHDVFVEQVDVACRAGASGFMVGRALWGDAVTADPGARDRVMSQVAVPRLRELRDTATRVGHGWTRGRRLPEPGAHWFGTY